MKDDTTLIDAVLKKIPNKYYAVVIASKRARDLNMGLAPLIKTNSTKPTTTALEEIAAGEFTTEMAYKGIKAIKGEVKMIEKQLPTPSKIEDDEELIEEEEESEEDNE